MKICKPEVFNGSKEEDETDPLVKMINPKTIKPNNKMQIAILKHFQVKSGNSGDILSKNKDPLDQHEMIKNKKEEIKFRNRNLSEI